MQQNRITLNNGIKVIHYYLPASDTVTIALIFGVGSAHENPKEYGIAHFTEHVVLNGSKHYPNSRETDILLETNGMLHNAWTFKNITNYYVKSPIKNFPLAVKVLLDNVFLPLFEKETIGKEKKIIIEEIRMDKDIPVRNCWENLCLTLFSHNSLAHPTIGYEDTVKNFTREMIINFYSRNYTKENMRLWVGGNISLARTIKILEGLKFPPVPNKHKAEHRILPKRKFNQLIFEKMDINSYYVDIGLSGFNIESRDLEAFIVTNTILGIGRGSLLYRSLKLKKALVSDTGSELSPFAEDGVMVTYLSCIGENLKEAIALALEEMRKIYKGNIRGEDLTRAKEIIKSDFLSMTETSDAFGTSESVFNLAIQEILAKHEVSYEKVLKAIDQISVSDIAKALSRITQGAKLAVSIVGPQLAEKKRLAEIIAKFKL